MGDVINLNQARKARTKQVKAREAENNRARFGQTKVERQRNAAESEKARRELEGKKKSPPEGGDDQAG